MSVLAPEAAPPIPIPNKPPVEEYGIDPSIAYSSACNDVLRAARRLPEHSTLALAGLLVSTEVEVARVRKDMKQASGVGTEVFARKQNFLEQYPGMFVAEREIEQDQVDMAITLAIGAIYALRVRPEASFDVMGFLEQSYQLELSARNI